MTEEFQPVWNGYCKFYVLDVGPNAKKFSVFYFQQPIVVGAVKFPSLGIDFYLIIKPRHLRSLIDLFGFRFIIFDLNKIIIRWDLYIDKQNYRVTNNKQH